MNDPDNFLGRWSRRKREAGIRQDEKGSEADALSARCEGEEAGSGATTPALGARDFDVRNLPSIESIGAGTDISAFMQKGVPDALRHAALRRAWSADPTIRDFMGPTENYWDAVGPDGIPGFGDLDPGLDVQRMVSELFGETAHADLAQPESPEENEESTMNVAPSPTGTSPEAKQPPRAVDTPLTAQGDLSHRTENAATQNDRAESPPAEKIARRHGGAIPR